MKIYDFLKEKIVYIISMSVVTLLTFLIIWALNPVGGPTLALLIVVLEIIGTVLPLTFEYIN